MFDLEKEIKRWRKGLLKSESMEDGYVEELESHLYDEIGRLKESGLTEEEAFKEAIENVGTPDSIGAE